MEVRGSGGSDVEWALEEVWRVLAVPRRGGGGGGRVGNEQEARMAL